MSTPHGTISRRLTLMNMLVSSIALLIAGVAFAAHDLATFRAETVRNLSTEARMVASNSVTALLFNDPRAAEETLAALRASSDVMRAQVYTPDGHLFAAYSRDGSPPMPPPNIPPGLTEMSEFDASSVYVARLVVSDGRPVGIVRIRADLQEMYDRLARYALIVVSVLLVSLAGALLVSRVSQRAISRPLAAVAAVARQVSQEKDYAVRAPRVETPYELAVLVDSFNAMLLEIQQRDRSLRDAQVQLEARVRERTEELHASNSELEAFSYSVSHDLRAPLRHITGFATLLEQQAGASLDEHGRRYLTTITEAAARMATLIDDLLAFSRMGRASVSKRRVDLSQLVGEARNEVSADLNGRRIAWEIHDLPAVDADPALLRPVLVNLLSNAVKYTGTRDHARIEVGTESRDGEVVVFVRDNGVGFDMAYAHKLFGVFQRLHRADEFGGTGIGLANVRRIIQRHGGRTWAEGAVDAGATFYFSLPTQGVAV
ncbi:MAG TPA: ATP-binding protein [Vicinamibacterales bacterium]|jgi:signal transduction histidine kinase